MENLKMYEQFTKEHFNYLMDKDKTYLRNFTNYKKDVSNFDIKEEIKNYDFDRFEVEYDGFEMTIYPDKSFKNLLKKLEEKIDMPNLLLSIDMKRLNSINLDFNLPLEFRGLSIGYKIYKLSIKKFDFITSDYGISEFASGIWSKLMLDEDFYAYTSGSKHKFGCSGAINRNISNNRLYEILEKIKNEIYEIYHVDFRDIIFDEKIKEKMEWK